METRTIITALIISIANFGVIWFLLYMMYRKIAVKINENSLKNSTFSLLEHSYWKRVSEIKDLEIRLSEAMADSVRAHKQMDEIATKLMESGN